MPLAAQHWLGPSYQPLVKTGGKPYRRYVDWHDQGQLKEAWIGVVPLGSGVRRRSENGRDL